MTKDSIYVLVHLPKCGGRSVFKFFQEIFGVDSVLNLYTNLFDNNTDDEAIAAFDSCTLDLSKYKAVCGGHMEYGASPERFQGRKPLYVSLMREPLERFVSYFNYLSVSDEEAKDLPGRFPSSNPALVQLAKSCNDIEEFYHRLLKDEDPGWNTSNIQSMFLTGTKACSVESVMDAIDNGFHLVMPLPMIDHFCGIIAAENGVENWSAPHQNFAPPRAKIADISPEFRELYRRRAELDYFAYYYVYSKALQLITKQMESERDALANDLRRLKRRQRLLNFIPGLRHSPDGDWDSRRGSGNGGG